MGVRFNNPDFPGIPADVSSKIEAWLMLLYPGADITCQVLHEPAFSRVLFWATEWRGRMDQMPEPPYEYHLDREFYRCGVFVLAYWKGEGTLDLRCLRSALGDADPMLNLAAREGRKTLDSGGEVK